MHFVGHLHIMSYFLSDVLHLVCVCTVGVRCMPTDEFMQTDNVHSYSYDFIVAVLKFCKGLHKKVQLSMSLTLASAT